MPRRPRAGFFPLILPALAAAALLACAASGLGDDNQRPPRRVLQRAAPSWNNDWSRGAVFYEVFVRSFQDSNGDGIGDLKGLIAKLDYLNDGNPDYHHRPRRGRALADAGLCARPATTATTPPTTSTSTPSTAPTRTSRRLCTEAHRRGIRVIVDFVDQPQRLRATPGSWTRRPGRPRPSATGTSGARSTSGWRQPWNMTADADTWHQNAADGQWFYGVFWAGMPDLNIRNPEVRAEIKRLATLWLARGVDGFRLDAARHLIENGGGLVQVDQPETHAFWREFAAHVAVREARGHAGGRELDRHADHRDLLRLDRARFRAATSCR